MLLGESGVRAIFEVGARDCRDTLGFHASFPQADITAFECNPGTLPECRAAIAGLAGVRLIEKAASDREGRVRFFSVVAGRDGSHNPGASSLLQATGRYPLEHYQQREIEVEATTLKGVMQELRIETIDLLWIDAQGAELLVLQGLGESARDVKLVQAEVEFLEIYRGQPLFSDIHEFLSARDFVFLGFNSYHRFFADAVYARSDCFPPQVRGEVARRFPFLARNRRRWLRHRAKRALRRWIGLPAWPA